jgi:hypothetical protein
MEPVVGTDSNVIAAIDRAISLKNQYKIGVINLSIGRRVYTSFTQDPVSGGGKRLRGGIVGGRQPAMMAATMATVPMVTAPLMPLATIRWSSP